MNNKNKLTTKIERTLHSHIEKVKEGTVDFTHLYIQRHNIQVDRPTLTRVLEIVRQAIDSEHLNKLDMFMRELDDTLNTVVSKE